MISCTGEVAPMFLAHSWRQMCTLHLINKKYRFNSWTSPSQTREFPEVIQVVSYLTQSLDLQRKPKSSFSSPLSSKPSAALSPRLVYAFQKQNYMCHPEKKPKKKWFILVFQCAKSLASYNCKRPDLADEVILLNIRSVMIRKQTQRIQKNQMESCIFVCSCVTLGEAAPSS